ncbi:hypothetical protein D8770_26570 [Methylobacterium sp. DB1607]|nr:hypothetical protein [Methylobacterium sp. DB1607]
MSETPKFEVGYVENGRGELITDTGIAFSGEDFDLELRGEGASTLMRKIVVAVNSRDEMVAALREAELQIDYLHDKFQTTGTGSTVLAKIRSILAVVDPA